MITLAIDASTARGSIALLDSDRPTTEKQFGRGQLFSVLPLSPPDLIVVGVGPGSFTGIRASIAAAKGLALTRHVPLQAANSFDAMARTALPQIPRDCPQMCVLGDARRDEVYFALYDRAGRPVDECRISALEAIEVHNPIWFVSAEMEKYRDSLRETFGGFASLCEMPVFPRAALLQPSEVPLEPIYLRETDYKKL